MVEPTRPSHPTPPLRIRRLRVEKLFDALTHDVDLKADARVTIVLGANGVGKTQLFECVAALFSGHLERLVAVPFAALKVELDDGNTLRVEQRTAELPPKEIRPDDVALSPRMVRRMMRSPRVRRSLSVQLYDQDGAPSTEPWEPENRSEQRRAAEAELPPWIERVDFGRWFDARSDRILTTRDMKVIYGLDEAAFENGPPWFKAILERTSVRLIETQRLLRTHRKSSRHHHPAEREGTAIQFAVRDLIEDLSERKARVGQKYARQQSLLDQTYVNRFLEYEAPSESAEALQQRLTDIAGRRVRLERLGLIDADASAESADRMHGVSDEKRLALSLHASDMDQKLRVLEPLATQLETLISTVNRKLLSSGKRLTTDPLLGLAVETEGGPQRLQLELLSSGEQHQLVLLYDLLFRVRRQSLVLIDEPELSLHPAWQQEFVEDLISIAQAQEFDVVLATHSPYIVGGRSSLCVTLEHQPALQTT